MNKLIFTLATLFFLNSNAFANENTILINLDKIPEKALDNITQNGNLINSELDLTNEIVFVNKWNDNSQRKQELMSLYSRIIPAAFGKFPDSREFSFSTYIKYNDKVSGQKVIKAISKLVISKDDFQSLNWDNINSFPENKKAFKVFMFNDI